MNGVEWGNPERMRGSLDSRANRWRGRRANPILCVLGRARHHHRRCFKYKRTSFPKGNGVRTQCTNGWCKEGTAAGCCLSASSRYRPDDFGTCQIVHPPITSRPNFSRCRHIDPGPVSASRSATKPMDATYDLESDDKM